MGRADWRAKAVAVPPGRVPSDCYRIDNVGFSVSVQPV